MIFLESLAKKLEDDGFGIRGDNIFVDQLNENINEAILLTDRLTGTTRYLEIPDYRMTRFNLIVRGVGKEAVIKKNYKAAQSLAVEQEIVLDGILFKLINPLHDPITFPKSEGGYVESFIRIETYFVVQDYGDYANP